MAQISEAVARFLPVYRRDLEVGMTWADTSSGKVMQQQVEVDRTIVTTYTVVGDTVISGKKALQVNRLASTKAAGNGVAGGAPVSLIANTTSDGRFFLSPSGAYLGGDTTDDIRLTLTIVSQNAEITLKQLAKTKVEAIK
jgi:hypothetical protein